MKRPEQTSLEPDYNFIDRIEAYADELEHDINLLLEYNDLEPDSPESGSSLTLSGEDNLFGDGTTGEEWPFNEAGDENESRGVVITYILNGIIDTIEDLKVLVADEST